MRTRYLIVIWFTCFTAFGHTRIMDFKNALAYANRDTICEKQVIVKVSDASLGNPISGARVILLDPRENMIADQQTDAQGNASFIVPCNSEYRIEIRHDGFETGRFPVNIAPNAVSPVIVEAKLLPIAPIMSSGGHLLDFKVQVYNPRTTPLSIRFGEDAGNLQTITIAAGKLWESPQYPTDQRLQIWVTTRGVIKKYFTLPGKAYQLIYDNVRRLYGIEEVPRRE